MAAYPGYFHHGLRLEGTNGRFLTSELCDLIQVLQVAWRRKGLGWQKVPLFSSHRPKSWRLESRAAVR